jgi:hypothetical protein
LDDQGVGSKNPVLGKTRKFFAGDIDEGLSRMWIAGTGGLIRHGSFSFRL